VIGTTKECVNLLSGTPFVSTTRNQVRTEQDNIDGREHIHGIEPFLGEEERNHLLKDGIGNDLAICCIG
jgi:hypothetical protein